MYTTTDINRSHLRLLRVPASAVNTNGWISIDAQILTKIFFDVTIDLSSLYFTRHFLQSRERCNVTVFIVIQYIILKN